MSNLPKSLRQAQCCATCKHCGKKSPYDDIEYYYCWLGAEKPNPPEPPPESDWPIGHLWATGAHFERPGLDVQPGQVCDHWEIGALDKEKEP